MGAEVAAQDALPRRARGDGAPAGWFRRHQHLLVFALMVGISTVFSEYFLTVENVVNILRQVAVIGLLAVEATFVVISGGVDLSVGGIAALCSVRVALAAERSIPAAFGLPVLIGTVVGLGIQPFIVTLATGSIAEGLAFSFSDGNPIRFENAAVSAVGKG